MLCQVNIVYLHENFGCWKSSLQANESYWHSQATNKHPPYPYKFSVFFLWMVFRPLIPIYTVAIYNFFSLRYKHYTFFYMIANRSRKREASVFIKPPPSIVPIKTLLHQYCNIYSNYLHVLLKQRWRDNKISKHRQIWGKWHFFHFGFRENLYCCWCIGIACIYEQR